MKDITHSSYLLLLMYIEINEWKSSPPKENPGRVFAARHNSFTIKVIDQSRLMILILKTLFSPL